MQDKMAGRVSGFGTTIFSEMSRLAREHGAINLSQGFPDFPAPDWVKEAAVEAIRADVNQYAVGHGAPRLRRAIAAKAASHNGIEADPEAEITVTSGATEAIFATLMGLVNPGEEVILFEPFYDSYVPGVIMAGGRPRFCTLRAPDWHFDGDELAGLFNERTKAILINTPHNPTGKVYSRDELEFIADLCRRWDVVAITDEVYEHIIFDGAQHVSLATLPGLWERTVTINSTAKTFSLTGWKIGWAIAPPPLTAAVRRAHQFITFCSAAPLQEAIAHALEAPDDYYATLTADYQARRDYLIEALRRAGMQPIVPQGTYFVMADIAPFGFADDVAFCRYLTTEVGVAAIPPSFFYEHKEHGRQLARFCFCKTMETLAAAAERLAAMVGGR